ncbi:MAG TPA: YetF domain-containing protein [Pyrinomonadaceae bacterium]
MLESIWDFFLTAVGDDRELANMSVLQIAFRSAFVYLAALVLIRIAKRRFLGGYSAIDILLGFIVGTIMARTVVGAVSVFNMFVVIGVLMGMHWLLATLEFYWSPVGDLIENKRRKLVVDGEVNKVALKESKISDEELKQAIRECGLEKVEDVKVAYLERDGSISVIPKRD